MALRTIAELPIPEQDNMMAANMRQIARTALGKGEVQFRESSGGVEGHAHDAHHAPGDDSLRGGPDRSNDREEAGIKPGPLELKEREAAAVHALFEQALIAVLASSL